LNDKFFVSAGACLQTPIYSLIVWETLNTKMEEISGQTVCETEIIVNKNKTGNTFSDLQIGVGGSFTYMFVRQFGVKFGVFKDLNNIFNKSVPSFTFNASDEFKPLRFSLGLRYMLGGIFVKKKEIMEKI